MAVVSTEADKAAFLVALRKVGTVKGAERLISPEYPQRVQNRVKTWRRRDPDFDAEVRAVIRGEALPDDVENGVPNFYDWRERHCAYWDVRTKRVVRVRNLWFQRQMTEAIEKNNRLIVVMPPGHLKTSFGIEYVTWSIMRNRNFRATIIRANEDEAAKNVAAIAQRLSDADYYEALIDDLERQGVEPITDPIKAYGGAKGYITQGSSKIHEQWSRLAFRVSGSTSGEKEPTVQAMGMSSAIVGNRADLIVMDDPQDPNRYRASPISDTEKKMQTFRVDILGRINDQQKLVVFANRLGPGDFVGELIKEYQDIWTVVYYPAILDEDKKRLLCPEIWTWEGLQLKRREVGEDVWAFHWMQEETSSADAHFTYEQMDACKDYDRSLGEIPEQAKQRILGVDPATVGYTAMVAWGVDPATGRRYLIDYLNERGLRTEDNIVFKAVRMALDYGCRTIAFEVRNIQGSMFEKLKEAAAPHGIRVVAYKTATATGAQAESSDFSITSIAALMDQRMVSLPYKVGDEETQRRMKPYIEQFVAWRPRPPGKTSWHLVRDMVMATLFAESEARKHVRSGERPRRRRGPDVPDWVVGHDGGWDWQNETRQKRRRQWQQEIDDTIEPIRHTLEQVAD